MGVTSEPFERVCKERKVVKNLWNFEISELRFSMGSKDDCRCSRDVARQTWVNSSISQLGCIKRL